jgi:transcription antitermination factor NusG
MSDCWYALHVKPRFEKLVTTQLDQKGYETLLPIYVSRRKWSDRIKTLSLPLFPGYIFCRFNINARLPIVATPGVMRILGIGRIPTPVNESEIASIQHVMDSGAQAQPHPYVAAGQMVEIESGPLQGLKGIIVRLKGSDRLVVSVSLLMRSVAVEVDQNSVRPLREVLPSLSNMSDDTLRVAAACETTSHPSRRPTAFVEDSVRVSDMAVSKQSLLAITSPTK